MKISIALTTYNGEKYLREQLDSILKQSIQDFELVITDDSSTDSTLKILNEYAEKDSRIKVFFNEKNLGFKKNFEKAISLCSGDYIALSDQDDVWTENHLQVLLENIGSNDFVGANAFLCDEDAKPTGTDLLSCSKIDFLPDSKDDWFFFLLHSNIFQGAACMFRRSLVQKAIPIPENVKFHDYWLALIASVNGGVVYVNKCILYYRQHGANVTENEKWKFLKKIMLLKKAKSDAEFKINILMALDEKINLLNYKECIENAILYHSKQKNSFFCMRYFIKNYKKIYLNNEKILFSIRFFKHFAFGV
ncbi:glycosyltransferase family 2 protein [uncultured Treponema sp.]|uniref:glycosyltransferase family 2 protein n=1 Tax=uncultured Treponema sp. TaxID=162155 RepID=UPI0025EACDF6|nr:glycosyltransferase family 2 protein [uncultured Treponema sp.]